MSDATETILTYEDHTVVVFDDSSFSNLKEKAEEDLLRIYYNRDKTNYTLFTA